MRCGLLLLFAPGYSLRYASCILADHSHHLPALAATSQQRPPSLTPTLLLAPNSSSARARRAMSMLNSMHGSSQVYSESYWRPITGVAMIISCMVLAAMCSHRWPGWRWDDWRSLTLPKIAILLVLVDS